MESTKPSLRRREKNNLPLPYERDFQIAPFYLAIVAHVHDFERLWIDLHAGILPNVAKHILRRLLQPIRKDEPCPLDGSLHPYLDMLVVWCDLDYPLLEAVQK